MKDDLSDYGLLHFPSTVFEYLCACDDQTVSMEWRQILQCANLVENEENSFASSIYDNDNVC